MSLPSFPENPSLGPAPSLLLSPLHTWSWVLHPHPYSYPHLHSPQFPFFLYERWQEWKGQLGSMSLFLWHISPKLNKAWSPFQAIQQDTIRNSSILLRPMPSHGVTFTLLMTPSWRMKRREYGRQQNNTLTNSMNNTQ
jgi:hypothetical protein